jgi:hypothetical protein
MNNSCVHDEGMDAAPFEDFVVEELGVCDDFPLPVADAGPVAVEVPLTPWAVVVPLSICD